MRGKTAYDFKKARQWYVYLHLMYYIKNACFSSPLKMILSDIFYDVILSEETTD